ncbi:MAG TPA: flavin reductase family protein [Pseudolysinimonas sp.]|nr:flavin reductase family protein [Pseudolysinimonas sp.]
MTIVDSGNPVESHGFETVTKDPAAIRSAFNRFPSGIAALCAEVDGRPTALVASSFSVGVSFDPPLVLFSVQNSSSTWPVLRLAKSVGVSVLGKDHAQVCSQLASRTGDRFVGLDTVATESGSLFIGDSALWLDCTIMSETPAGDHQLVLLEVTSLKVEADREPLIYHGAAFRQLAAT